MLMMLHKRAEVLDEEKTLRQDSRAASLEAATIGQGSIVSLRKLKRSNPFAKKTGVKDDADSNKNDSILQSLKKMQTCAPDMKRKQGAASLQQRSAKMGKVALNIKMNAKLASTILVS